MILWFAVAQIYPNYDNVYHIFVRRCVVDTMLVTVFFGSMMMACRSEILTFNGLNCYH